MTGELILESGDVYELSGSDVASILTLVNKQAFAGKDELMKDVPATFDQFLQEEGLTDWYKFSIKAGKIILWALLLGSALLLLVLAVQIISRI
jgi:hypothetical protein